jgi:hypothetical protein
MTAELIELKEWIELNGGLISVSDVYEKINSTIAKIESETFFCYDEVVSNTCEDSKFFKCKKQCQKCIDIYSYL